MMRPGWVHLAFIGLSLILFVRIFPRSPHEHSLYAAKRSHFFASHAPRGRQTKVAPPRQKREAIWARPDAPAELVLAVSRDLLSSLPVHRLRVLPRLGALFCPIPGVASNALLRALGRAEGVGNEELPLLSEYALRDRERFLVRPDIFRFVFVRHPFARLLSAFYAGRAFSELDSPGYREFMGRVRGRPLAPDEHELQPLSFLFFLTFLSKQRRSELWDRFVPQSDLCGLQSFKYAFVGRLEQFEQDIAEVERRLSRKLQPLEPPSFSSNASQTLTEMFNSRKRRSKAMKLYDIDLKALGYTSVF